MYLDGDRKLIPSLPAHATLYVQECSQKHIDSSATILLLRLMAHVMSAVMQLNCDCECRVPVMLSREGHGRSCSPSITQVLC